MALCAALGIRTPQAMGHLHCLWHWALDYAQDGSLGRYVPAVIAQAADWDDDPRAFIDALVTSGFADATEHGIALHDWDDYTWRLAERQEENRAANSARRAEADARIRATINDLEAHGERLTLNAIVDRARCSKSTAQRVLAEHQARGTGRPVPPVPNGGSDHLGSPENGRSDIAGGTGGTGGTSPSVPCQYPLGAKACEADEHPGGTGGTGLPNQTKPTEPWGPAPESPLPTVGTTPPPLSPGAAEPSPATAPRSVGCAASGGGGDREPAPTPAEVRTVHDHWNQVWTPAPWPRPLLLTDTRRKAIRARLRTFTADQLCRAAERLHASPWHCGQNDRGWRAQPEWLYGTDERVEEWLQRPAGPSRSPPGHSAGPA